MRLILPVVIVLAGLWACSDAGSDPELDRLFELMQGSFSSEEQAEAHPEIFDIRLHMEPVWPELGRWLYVEQSVHDRPDEPYRQRVYHVYRDEEGGLISDVYTIENESFFVGAWQDTDVFENYSPEILVLREGCTVYLEAVGPEHFQGGTIERECPSSLQGATYATSEVEITPAGMRTWDRGYDADGNQVWGSEEQGYYFKRIR